jgi:hypothetical protein
MVDFGTFTFTHSSVYTQACTHVTLNVHIDQGWKHNKGNPQLKIGQIYLYFETGNLTSPVLILYLFEVQCYSKV